MEKNAYQLISITCTKLKPKWIKDIEEHKSRHTEPDRRESVEWPWTQCHRRQYLEKYTYCTGIKIRSAINKQNLLKLKSFYKSKDTVKRITWHSLQNIKWFSPIPDLTENYDLKYIKNSRIKASHKVNNKILKMGYRSTQRLLNRGISNDLKTLKKCSPFLAIRHMKIKTTLRFHLTPLRMANMSHKWQLMLLRM